MRCHALALLAACGSSTSPINPPPDGRTGSHDAPASQPGFHLVLDGQDFILSGAKVSDEHGHFSFKSDPSSEPSIAVALIGSTLGTGTFPCARSSSNDAFDETAASVFHWFDGDDYYTNVTPAPSCTATISAVSATQVVGSISGMINKEVGPDFPAVAFSLDFVAMP